MLWSWLVGVLACGSRGTAPGTPAVLEERVARVPADPSLSGLQERIRSRVAQEEGAEIGVALIDLGTGLQLELDAHKGMHAASTMKVPVMLEVFRQVEAGHLSLDDHVTITTQFRSIVGDSVYTLTADSDSDSTLYARAGGEASVRELVRLMIVRSSNLALNLLISRVGAHAVMETMTAIGADSMLVRRGVEDGPAFRQGLNNTTTAAAFATVLESIVRCTVTTRSSCDAMLDILAAQAFNDMIPAGVPPGTRVAHKTGWISGIRHDGGTVFPATRPPYVLAVLTRGFADTARAASVVADISRLVWEQLTDPSFNTWVRPSDNRTRTLLELHARFRVPALAQRHFGHAWFWRAVDPFLGRAVQREPVGRSGEGRPINLLRYGTGPTRVLLWSQMHGDEATATQALADIVRFLNASPMDPRALRWADRLTLLMIPMLNPDGAERFERHSSFGVDVNRDARALATPEGQTLKAVRDRWQPQFGFNLHDQNVRTRVSGTDRLAAISLLAPPVDAATTPTEAYLRAKQVAATIRVAIDPLVGGYITEYDDSFNPRAFGDGMQGWGTSTVLIESGGWRNDPEKQFLRAVNFVALVSALDAIADSTYGAVGFDPYDSLRPSGRAVNDLLIRGGMLVLRGLAPVRVDISVDFEGGNARPLRGRIAEVGDLEGGLARDTLDVPGLYLHPIQLDSVRPPRLSPGMDASFIVRSGSEETSETVYRIERGLIRAIPLTSSRR